MEILWIIVPVLVFIIGLIKIIVDWRNDIKELNREFLIEAKRINQLKRDLLG